MINIMPRLREYLDTGRVLGSMIDDDSQTILGILLMSREKGKAVEIRKNEREITFSRSKSFSEKMTLFPLQPSVIQVKDSLVTDLSESGNGKGL